MKLVKTLELKEIKEIYYSHMQEAFPQSELRPYKNIELLSKRGHYECYGLYEDAHLLAYAFFAKTEIGSYCLLDYYAVLDGLRGKGIGSLFFQLLREKMEHTNGFLIEVESIESTNDENEKQLRRRRIAFYEKNGNVMTKVKCLLYGVDFNIMLQPISAPVPSDEETLYELEQIYHTMFDDELYRRVCHPSIQQIFNAN